MSKFDNKFMYDDILTSEEKLGCVALWLNSLYTLFRVASEAHDTFEFSPDDWVACSYCPYEQKCHAVTPDPEATMYVVPSPPDVFKKVLEPHTGQGTVTSGWYPENKDDIKTFLEGMGTCLKDNCHRMLNDSALDNVSDSV